MDKLALFGGTKVRSTPFTPWPQFDDRERKYVMDALESRRWGGYPFPSPRALEFGRRFAEYHGARYGIPAANGTVTLEIALRAAGIKAGDEVIVPCYTFMATASCAVHLNAVPVFTDVEARSWCMDPAGVEAAITPKTKAIIPVHLGHQMTDMDRILEIAKRHGLVVIEDCAHSHGGQWRGKGVGSMGDFGSFSFQSSKLMTSGEGGAILCNDDTYRAKVMSLVNCGRKEPGYDGFDEQLFGWNFRLSELQIAVLMGQMDRLDEVTRKRAEMLAYFRETLHANVAGLRVLDTDPRVTRQHAYQTLMRFDSAAFAGIHRDRFLQALEAEGVDLDGTFYVPLYQIPIFNARSDEWPALRERYGEGILEGGRSISCPVAEKAAYEEAVWMHYPHLSGSRADVDDIVTAIAKVQRHAAELA
ncbi:MAG: DegT/DnrJ/EryC1/StrS family aminotransferase [Deltaproteobacteria bacterium]|nr:DegT/DnrJ/EryC1/StrS family aminotransferase [Deltaproteobacteria bacterium]